MKKWGEALIFILRLLFLQFFENRQITFFF
jgi:hypothetical protein